jgi:hypothetical protein
MQHIRARSIGFWYGLCKVILEGATMKALSFILLSLMSVNLYANTSMLCQDHDLNKPIINRLDFIHGTGAAAYTLPSFERFFVGANKILILTQDVQSGIYGVEIDVDGQRNFVWKYGREQGDYTDYLNGFPLILRPIADYPDQEFFEFNLNDDLFLNVQCIKVRPIDGCHNVGQWTTVYCPTTIPMS